MEAFCLLHAGIERGEAVQVPAGVGLLARPKEQSLDCGYRKQEGLFQEGTWGLCGIPIKRRVRFRVAPLGHAIQISEVLGFGVCWLQGRRSKCDTTRTQSLVPFWGGGAAERP